MASPDPSGKLTEQQRAVANKTPGEREDVPASVFLKPSERLYPVKEKRNGQWVYSRNLLLAAARRARMNHEEDLAKHADEIRAREFPDQQAHDGVNMSALKSRRALLAAGAITAYVRPKLAQDAKFDPTSMLEGITAKNFKASIPTIIEKVKEGTKGKLALDASPQELQSLLESLHGEQQEGDDEINPANPGLPDTSHEPINDEGPAHEFLASKLSPEDHAKFKQLSAEDSRRRADDVRRADDMRRKRADDARHRLGRDETEEELEEREKREAAEDARHRLGRDESKEEMEKREKREAEDRKKRRAEDSRRRADDARRREAEDSRRREAEDNKKKPPAMDEATVQAKIEEAVSKERIAQRAIQDALGEVRPYVGELKIAFDSADQVYRRALEMRGETGLDSVHPSAYKRLLLAKPLPGRPQNGATLPAMDSASPVKLAESIAKIAPGAAKVRLG